LPVRAAWRAEALQNFRELLDARGLDHHLPRRVRTSEVASRGFPLPVGVAPVSAPALAAPAVEGRSRSWLWALLGGSLLTAALVAAVRRQRRRRAGSAAPH
jgi:hypothetical protein